MYTFVIPFVQILLACVVLKYACDLFEQQSSFFGKRMPAGIRGATIDAVGSSMPEFMATVVVLFFMDNPTVAFPMALGIASGSAVYNCAVIPALAILLARDENGNKVSKISIPLKGLKRDVLWVVISDIALIAMIVSGYISIWMAVLLNLIYVGYVIHIIMDAKSEGKNVVETYEFEELEDRGLIGNILTFNFNKLFFKDKPVNLPRSVFLFCIALTIILLGTDLLIIGVEGAATVLGIAPFLSGLVFGAAASSLPDTLISMKAARKGEYADAVANPLASNTFDTSISVGLPLLVWLLWNGHSGMTMIEDNMTYLRLSVILMTSSIGVLLILNHNNICKKIAATILSLYAVWVALIYLVFV